MSKRLMVVVVLAVFVIACAVPTGGTAKPKSQRASEPGVANLLSEQLKLVNQAQTLIQGSRQNRFQPQAGPQHIAWSRRTIEALGEQPNRDELMAALEAHRDRMTEYVRTTQQMRDGGAVGELELLDARYYELESQLWLARAKSDSQEPTKGAKR